MSADLPSFTSARWISLLSSSQLKGHKTDDVPAVRSVFTEQDALLWKHFLHVLNKSGTRETSVLPKGHSAYEDYPFIVKSSFKSKPSSLHVLEKDARAAKISPTTDSVEEGQIEDSQIEDGEIGVEDSDQEDSPITAHSNEGTQREIDLPSGPDNWTGQECGDLKVHGFGYLQILLMTCSKIWMIDGSQESPLEITDYEAFVPSDEVYCGGQSDDDDVVKPRLKVEDVKFKGSRDFNHPDCHHEMMNLYRPSLLALVKFREILAHPRGLLQTLGTLLTIMSLSNLSVGTLLETSSSLKELITSPDVEAMDWLKSKLHLVANHKTRFIRYLHPSIQPKWKATRNINQRIYPTSSTVMARSFSFSRNDDEKKGSESKKAMTEQSPWDSIYLDFKAVLPASLSDVWTEAGLMGPFVPLDSVSGQGSTLMTILCPPHCNLDQSSSHCSFPTLFSVKDQVSSRCLNFKVDTRENTMVVEAEEITQYIAPTVEVPTPLPSSLPSTCSSIGSSALPTSGTSPEPIDPHTDARHMDTKIIRRGKLPSVSRTVNSSPLNQIDTKPRNSPAIKRIPKVSVKALLEAESPPMKQLRDDSTRHSQAPNLKEREMKKRPTENKEVVNTKGKRRKIPTLSTRTLIRGGIWSVRVTNGQVADKIKQTLSEGPMVAEPYTGCIALPDPCGLRGPLLAAIDQLGDPAYVLKERLQLHRKCLPKAMLQAIYVEENHIKQMRLVRRIRLLQDRTIAGVPHMRQSRVLEQLKVLKGRLQTGYEPVEESIADWLPCALTQLVERAEESLTVVMPMISKSTSLLLRVLLDAFNACFGYNLFTYEYNKNKRFLTVTFHSVALARRCLIFAQDFPIVGLGQHHHHHHHHHRGSIVETPEGSGNHASRSPRLGFFVIGQYVVPCCIARPERLKEYMTSV